MDFRLGTIMQLNTSYGAVAWDAAAPAAGSLTADQAEAASPQKGHPTRAGQVFAAVALGLLGAAIVGGTVAHIAEVRDSYEPGNWGWPAALVGAGLGAWGGVAATNAEAASVAS
jgi:hypothetical protein